MARGLLMCFSSLVLFEEFEFTVFAGTMIFVEGNLRFSGSPFWLLWAREELEGAVDEKLLPKLNTFLPKLSFECWEFRPQETCKSTLVSETCSVFRVIGETLAVSFRLIASLVVFWTDSGKLCFTAEVKFIPLAARSTVLISISGILLKIEPKCVPLTIYQSENVLLWVWQSFVNCNLKKKTQCIRGRTDDKEYALFLALCRLLSTNQQQDVFLGTFPLSLSLLPVFHFHKVGSAGLIATFVA